MPDSFLNTVLLHIGPSANADISAQKEKKWSQKSSGGKKSHIDFALQARHIDTAGKRTTIAIEQAFWREADIQAGKVGQSWQQWAEYLLENRPASIGKARWLRVHLLREGGTC